MTPSRTTVLPWNCAGASRPTTPTPTTPTPTPTPTPTTPTGTRATSGDATPRVRLLRADDVTEAAELLARGFAEEPGDRVLFPDPQLRRELAELVFASQLRATLPYATAFGAQLHGRLGGVAIWHPPEVTPTSVRASMQLAAGLLVRTPRLLRGLPDLGAAVARHGAAAPRLILRRQRAVATAAAGPTWHLAYLATDPQLRGRGLARALLEHVLDRCDEDALAAWLETTDPVNPPLYARFGFQTVAHIDRAGWIPGLWVLRRDP